MNPTIRQRISDLRAWMRRMGVQAFVVPSTDPHLSEYVAQHWQSRQWVSGFTGSAGTVVVTLDEAGLWTDSRYFLQAADQLQGTGIDLYKEMLPQTPSIARFLQDRLAAGDTVGIDGWVFGLEAARHLQAELAAKGIGLRSTADPMADIWTDRPSLPQGPAQVYPLHYAGQPFAEKRHAVCSALQAAGADSLLLSALDEIAWVLNLRGDDVQCNPVVICYLLLSADEAHLFIDPAKLTPDVAEYLRALGVACHNYADVASFLQGWTGHTVQLEPGKTNYALRAALPQDCRVLEATSPVALLKAVRNATEVAGLHEAMMRDGVAMVHFLMWLEQAVPAGGETELSAVAKLHSLRAAQPLFVGDSFDTIAGYGPHGAIVHYEPTAQTDVPLQPSGFLLLDSGAQYLDGTTDITRTIPLGPLTDEERRDYTLVLKGHIALARAVFPEGTRGAQLDVLARAPMWQDRLNFLHGTGHGVGHYLNVHEGPQSIRMNENPVPLLPGMLTSNEPGIYRDGRHGVRTENLMLTVPAGQGMFGGYLRFETVTLCPIATSPIVDGMLDAEERAWLNAYHRKVCQRLAPLLDPEAVRWLERHTQPIG